jgi:hypothetical protein
MTSPAPVSASDYARLIAPAIDRVHLGGALANDADSVAAVAARHQPIPMEAIALLTAAVGPIGVSWPELTAAVRYMPTEAVRGQIEFLAGVGVVTADAERISFTPAALAAARDLVDQKPAALAALWARWSDRLPQLAAIARPVAIRAMSLDSPYASLTANLVQPTQPNAAYDLWYSVMAIRRFRADAHVAAWRAAGETEATMPTLPAGAKRDAIEARTNELNAVIFEGMSLDDQLTLIAGLAGLNGTGDPA